MTKAADPNNPEDPYGYRKLLKEWPYEKPPSRTAPLAAHRDWEDRVLAAAETGKERNVRLRAINNLRTARNQDARFFEREAARPPNPVDAAIRNLSDQQLDNPYAKKLFERYMSPDEAAQALQDEKARRVAEAAPPARAPTTRTQAEDIAAQAQQPVRTTAAKQTSRSRKAAQDLAAQFTEPPARAPSKIYPREQIQPLNPEATLNPPKPGASPWYIDEQGRPAFDTPKGAKYIVNQDILGGGAVGPSNRRLTPEKLLDTMNRLGHGEPPPEIQQLVGQPWVAADPAELLAKRRVAEGFPSSTKLTGSLVGPTEGVMYPPQNRVTAKTLEQWKSQGIDPETIQQAFGSSMGDRYGVYHAGPSSRIEEVQAAQQALGRGSTKEEARALAEGQTPPAIQDIIEANRRSAVSPVTPERAPLEPLLPEPAAAAAEAKPMSSYFGTDYSTYGLPTSSPQQAALAQWANEQMMAPASRYQLPSFLNATGTAYPAQPQLTQPLIRDIASAVGVPTAATSVSDVNRMAAADQMAYLTAGAGGRVGPAVGAAEEFGPSVLSLMAAGNPASQWRHLNTATGGGGAGGRGGPPSPPSLGGAAEEPRIPSAAELAGTVPPVEAEAAALGLKGRLAAQVGKTSVGKALGIGVDAAELGKFAKIGRMFGPAVAGIAVPMALQKIFPQQTGIGSDIRQVGSDVATGAGFGAFGGWPGAIAGGVAGGLYGLGDVLFDISGTGNQPSVKQTLTDAASAVGLDSSQYAMLYDFQKKLNPDASDKDLLASIGQQMQKDYQTNQLQTQYDLQRQSDAKAALAIQQGTNEFMKPYAANILSTGLQQSQILGSLADQLPDEFKGLFKNEAMQAATVGPRILDAYALQSGVWPQQYLQNQYLDEQNQMAKLQAQSGGSSSNFNALANSLAPTGP